jgi:hypothetical protein
MEVQSRKVYDNSSQTIAHGMKWMKKIPQRVKGALKARL